jgi:hypothetical protein
MRPKCSCFAPLLVSAARQRPTGFFLLAVSTFQNHGQLFAKARDDRLVAKGRNGKLALIAVRNKLLKQTYAIVTSGVPYQADFIQKVTAPFAFQHSSSFRTLQAEATKFCPTYSM